LPNVVKSEGLAGKFANGWGVATIVALQSGYPLTPSISGDRTLYNNLNSLERPDLCPNYDSANFKSTSTSTTTGQTTNAWTGDRSTSTFFNPGMLCLPVAGTLGNMPVGLFTGPGLISVDASITKDTKARFLGESGNIQFRLDFFNVINHPNFNPPNVVVFAPSGATAPAGGSIATLLAGGSAAAKEVSSTAGQDSTIAGTMRQLQVSLKLVF
jgi:hypothetical protein